MMIQVTEKIPFNTNIDGEGCNFKIFSSNLFPKKIQRLRSIALNNFDDYKVGLLFSGR